MNLLKVVDESTIESEHICCALSEKKGENCVVQKRMVKRAVQRGVGIP